MVDRIQGPDLSMGARAGDLKERALEFAAHAREEFSGKSGILKEYITKQPALSLGIAAGMGVLLGWLIKRR